MAYDVEIKENTVYQLILLVSNYSYQDLNIHVYIQLYLFEE